MRNITLFLCATLLATVSFAQGMTFKGFDCKSDCSGHRAGYAWAQRKGITDTSQCGGNSQSFYEGCLAYAMGR